MQTVRMDLSSVSVYYEEYGEGRPFVSIHGFYPDHRLMKGCMEPVLSRRPGWRRIYFDLPGMGNTPAEPWIKGSDQMLDVVMDFIDRLIPDDNFVLAGESYGGYLARGVIKRIPDRVDGLFLLCPMVVAQREKRTLAEHKVISEDADFVSSLDDPGLLEFTSTVVVQNRHTWSRVLNEVIQGLRLADDKFLTRLYNEGYAFKEDLDSAPKVYSRPTLLALGRQDSSVGYRDAWRLVELFPRGTFVVLDRAGHNLQIEQETLFNTLVNEWLDRVEEYNR